MTQFNREKLQNIFGVRDEKKCYIYGENKRQNTFYSDFLSIFLLYRHECCFQCVNSTHDFSINISKIKTTVLETYFLKCPVFFSALFTLPEKQFQVHL